MSQCLTTGPYDPVRKRFQIVRWRGFLNMVCIVLNTIAGFKATVILFYQDTFLYLNEASMSMNPREAPICKSDELN